MDRLYKRLEKYAELLVDAKRKQLRARKNAAEQKKLISEGGSFLFGSDMNRNLLSGYEEQEKDAAAAVVKLKKTVISIAGQIAATDKLSDVTVNDWL